MINCFYCNSSDHNEETKVCPKRQEDATRFTKESPYINTKRVNLRKEKYTVYCGRPNKYQKGLRFGNPFIIGPDGDRHMVIRKYKNWLKGGENYGNLEATHERRLWVLRNVHTLKGEVLGCFCNEDQECHTEVLIDMAYNFSLDKSEDL